MKTLSNSFWLFNFIILWIFPLGVIIFCFLYFFYYWWVFLNFITFEWFPTLVFEWLKIFLDWIKMIIWYLWLYWFFAVMLFTFKCSADLYDYENGNKI